MPGKKHEKRLFVSTLGFSMVALFDEGILSLSIGAARVA
jgi:hypothetical protein